MPLIIPTPVCTKRLGARELAVARRAVAVAALAALLTLLVSVFLVTRRYGEENFYSLYQMWRLSRTSTCCYPGIHTALRSQLHHLLTVLVPSVILLVSAGIGWAWLAIGALREDRRRRWKGPAAKPLAESD